MGKRKRKQSKGKPFAGVRDFFGGLLMVILKVLPPAVIIVAAGGIFFGVRNALYADLNLNVDKIVVEPSDALTTKARQDLESRWLGKNILAVDLKKVSADLEKSPEIKTARVIRRLPSMLKIEIEKRKPIAFVQFSPRALYALISEDGMVLDVVKERNASLVMVEAFALGDKEPQLGSKIKIRGFVEAMKFLKAFWDHPLARQETVTKMGLDHLGNLTITLGAGPDIRLGREPYDRLGAIEKIMHLLLGDSRTKIEYIDLQFDNVIVKRKK